jgi:hypothetical protein
MTGASMTPDPDPATPAGPPAFALPGRAIIAACDRRLIELQVVEGARPDGSWVARAPRLLVREGLPVELRVFDEGCVWRLTFRIVAAAPMAQGAAEIELEQVGVDSIGEERTAPRVPWKSLATLRSVYYAAYEIGAFRVQTVELSCTSVAFECERHFETGQQYDLALDDEAGQTIYSRIEVARTEPGLFGRTRAFARFLALDTHDRLLLEQLISRQLLQGELAVEQEPVPAVRGLREQLLAEKPGRLSRLLRRA